MMLNKLSLNTIGLNRIGLNRIGKPSRGSSDRPYIDPEVLASLKAVCICYGKSNDDPDRAIVKNLVDPDNPFVISNAAYKLNSGFGLYAADFTTWTKVEGVETTSHGFRMVGEVPSAYWILFLYNTIVPSCKIRVSGIPEGGNLKYANSVILKNGINEIPEMVVGAGANGFTRNLGTTQVSDWIGLSVEQIPSYQGAFVTDGVNDLITSTKTVQEMGITKACTVISMIHHMDVPSDASFNNIRNSTAVSGRNGVYASGTTGIYGWSKDYVSGTSTTLINNILGDKNNYTNAGGGSAQVDNMKFSVQGFISDSGVISETSQVAWYWTVIANKVLTTDQINQVIAYYNLDRCVEPTVLYDVKRQGLSNDTPDSDWYLKDFSKNGFDMSLFNFAKKLDSGIGKYGMDFLEWKSNSGMNFTSTKLTSTKPNLSGGWLTFRNVSGLIPETKVKVSGAPREFVFIANNNGTDDKFSVTINNGVYTIPEFTLSSASGFYINNSGGDWSNLVIEQIPSHAGALCFDGVEDYGKVTGLPIYKDYTVVADREIVDGLITNADGGVATRGTSFNNGAFCFDLQNSVFSFGSGTSKEIDIRRVISYQSKYINNGLTIGVGNVIDTNPLCIARLGSTTNRYSKLALWAFLLFPYSLSEFLIERQLKKHKLGTLYPDMVEFRPVIKTNVDYTLIQFYINNYTKRIYPGDYIPINTPIQVNFYLKNNVDELISFKVNGNDSTFKRSTVVDNAYNIETLPITTSPQKIDIAIDEYIRYEDIDFTDCYPGVPRIYVDDKSVTWGNKLKVGDKFTFYGNVNILPEMYNVLVKAKYNGEEMTYGSIGTITKSMAFTSFRTYTFDNNEPKCILSPSRLRIPNSSYKILGYIPDISGHGNHGKINNSAYAEGSGVNADGSYQLDGVDDFITIPTLSSGGKQVLMKVNWQSSIGQGMLYDQRGTAFAIWNSDKYNDDETDTIPAYSARNGGNTYIDGILNKNILASQLRNITHNIVATNTMLNGSSVSPTIGCRTEHDAYFTNMSLYDFMLFDEISTDEEILTLNEYVGIEGNTDDLFTENN